MGLKSKFTRKQKEPTVEENRAHLEKAGIAVKLTNGREEKFLSFRDYAREKQKEKLSFKPANPYQNMNQQLAGNNPYANNGGSNPYGGPSGHQNNAYGDNVALSSRPSGPPQTANGRSGSNPYGVPSTASNNSYSSSPYGGSGSQSNPYGRSNASGPPSNGTPYESSSSNPSNPSTSYGNDPYGGSRGSTDVYGGSGSSGSKDVYGYNSKSSHGSLDPVAGGRQPALNSIPSNPYGNSNPNSSSNPYGNANPNSSSNPYSALASRGGRDDESSMDLNRVPTNLPGDKHVYKPAYEPSVDLNNVAEDEDDLNLQFEDLPEQEEVNSEDEEVQAIKQDIRFTKQQSVELTRNTLRMAQEADISGTNTLGMLGSQSERLYSAEQNLALADTQTGIAKEKVEELRRLNRSIFIPATSINPFNKKLKLRAQEQRLQSQKMQEKYTREQNRQGIYESELRIKQGLTNNATNSTIHLKYKNEANLEAAKRYQFENDSEDDEMEKELALNLDQIAAFSKKLRNTANVMTQEVDSQNERLKKIEEDADRLDINVHMNSARLNNIR